MSDTEGMIKFKPELWSKTITKELDVITGMRKHSDYSFNSEIKYGTKLHITRLGDTTVRDYLRNDESSFQVDVADGSEMELTIDQRRYFAKKYDDIDSVQAIPGAVEADMRETAKALAIDADQFVSARLYQAVVNEDSNKPTIASSATAITPNEKNTLTAIEDGLVVLYSNNVPTSTEIWGEVSPKFYSEFRKYLTELATTNLDLMKKGIIGKYNNVNICIENQLPVASNVRYNFLRTGKAFAFAEQIDKVTTTDVEKGFGKIFKGLYVYGGLVAEPKQAYAIKETYTASDSTFLTR